MDILILAIALVVPLWVVVTLLVLAFSGAPGSAATTMRMPSGRARTPQDRRSQGPSYLPTSATPKRLLRGIPGHESQRQARAD